MDLGNRDLVFLASPPSQHLTHLGDVKSTPRGLCWETSEPVMGTHRNWKKRHFKSNVIRFVSTIKDVNVCLAFFSLNVLRVIISP